MAQLQTLATNEEKPKELETEKLDREFPPLYVKSGSSQLILELDSISHITVEDHYCHIHTQEEAGAKSYFVKSSLAELLENLPQNHFIQIHRSHVVNVQAIRQFDKKSRSSKVYLKSDVILPVSRHRLNEVVAQLESMI